MESSSGLTISSLKDFRETNPSENDIIFISGSNTFQMFDSFEDQAFFEWINKANCKKTTICSICNGAYLLAKAGLLN